MLRDLAVDILMGRLGQRVSTVTRQQIINEMVQVQETTLEGDPTPMWFLLSEKSTAYTTAGEERLLVPTDFLLEWEEGALYYVDDNGDEQIMGKEDWDILKYKITGSGRPEYYAFAGDYFLLRKIPDAAYPIAMRYYQQQASLAGVYGDASNIENNWLKHASDWLIAETGIVIASQYLQSEKMERKFEQQALKAHNRLIAKDTVIKETNISRYMEA